MPGSSPPVASPRATFRLPMTGLIGVFAFVVCVTPLAFAGPGLLALYLLPLGVAVWLVRSRTVAGADAVVARGVLRTRRLPWSEIDGLRVQERSWVRAVLGGGTEVTLPAVRARDLPMLAAVSGGRIDNPLMAPIEQPSAAPATTPTTPAAPAAPTAPATDRADDAPE